MCDLEAWRCASVKAIAHHKATGIDGDITKIQIVIPTNEQDELHTLVGVDIDMHCVSAWVTGRRHYV